MTQWKCISIKLINNANTTNYLLANYILITNSIANDKKNGVYQLIPRYHTFRFGADSWKIVPFRVSGWEKNRNKQQQQYLKIELLCCYLCSNESKTMNVRFVYRRHFR